MMLHAVGTQTWKKPGLGLQVEWDFYGVIPVPSNMHVISVLATPTLLPATALVFLILFSGFQF